MQIALHSDECLSPEKEAEGRQTLLTNAAASPGKPS